MGGAEIKEVRIQGAGRHTLCRGGGDHGMESEACAGSVPDMPVTQGPSNLSVANGTCWLYCSYVWVKQVERAKLFSVILTNLFHQIQALRTQLISLRDNLFEEPSEG